MMTDSERREWLEIRRTGIGSSDAPAVCGISPWKTPAGVWAEKLGLVPESTMTEPMEWGLRLEDAIGRAYSDRTGKALVRRGIVRHPETTWLLASPDFIREDGAAIVECKNVGDQAADQWGEPGTDEIPEHYLVQVQHQMAATGIRQVDVAALFGGRRLAIYTVHFDAATVEEILAIEADFWRLVEAKEDPGHDWAHPSTPALVEALNKPTDRRAVLPESALELIYEYERLGEVGSQTEKERKAVKARIIDLLGDAGEGLLADGRIVSRKTIERAGYTVEPSSYVDFRIKKAPKKARAS